MGRSSTYTLEAWVYPDALTTIQGIWASEPADGSDYQQALSIWTDGALWFYGHGSSRTSPPGGLTAATWYHTAAVLDNGQLRLYINGLQVDSISVGATPAADAGYRHLLGRMTYSNRRFTGRACGFALYPTALTQQTLADHNTLGRAADTGGGGGPTAGDLARLEGKIDALLARLGEGRSNPDGSRHDLFNLTYYIGGFPPPA